MANCDPPASLALIQCREDDVPLEEHVIRDLIDLVNVEEFCLGEYALPLLNSTIRYVNDQNADWARLICQKIIEVTEFSRVLTSLSEQVLADLLNNINYYVYDNLLDCIVTRAIKHQDNDAIVFVFNHLLLLKCINTVCSEDFGEDDTGPNLDRPLTFSQLYPNEARIEDWEINKIYGRLRFSRQSFEVFCSILLSVVQSSKPPKWIHQSFKQDWSLLYDHNLGEHFQDPVAQLSCRLFHVSMGKIDYEYLKGMAAALLKLYEDEVTGQGLYDSEDYSQALRDFVMFLGFGVPEAQSHCQYQFHTDPIVVASQLFVNRELDDLCFFDYEFEEIFKWCFEDYKISSCPDPIFICFVHMIDREEAFNFVKEKSFSCDLMSELSTDRLYRILRQMVRYEHSLEYLLNDLLSIMENLVTSANFEKNSLNWVMRKEIMRSLLRQRIVDLDEWRDSIESAFLKINDDGN